ncbi:MAG: hypothetical protein ABSF92_12620 [Candidatus Acidiferrales bacterium]
MGKLNWVRLLLGGLLAGVVINIFEFVTNDVFLGKHWDAAMRALGRHLPPHAMPLFIIWGFVLGIAAIWLYAVARPRFGPGPKTAIFTGLGCWVLAYVLGSLSAGAMGLVPYRLLVIGTIVGLVEILLASLAGAWVYKE